MLVFDFISAIAGSLKVLWFYWNYQNPVFIYSYLLLLWCKSRALGICVMQQSKQLSVLELMGSKKNKKPFFLLYTICHHGNRLDALVSFMWMLLFWLCDGWMQFCFMVISNVLFKCGFSHFQVHFGTPPPPSFLFLFDSNNNVTSFCWKWWNKLCTLSCFVLALQPNWKEFVKCTLLESV